MGGEFGGECVHAKWLQWSPTLCSPIDCSPPGSSVYGLLHARILEFTCLPPVDLPKLVIEPMSLTSPALSGSFLSTSTTCFPPRGETNVKVKVLAAQPCPTLCSPMDCSLPGSSVHGRMDAWICMTESLCCPPETIITLLIGYTLISNKKLKQAKEKSRK